MATWEVMTVALAPKRYIDIFADYYLSSGASKIRIFFDGGITDIFDDNRIKVVSCDEDFWKNCGISRPNAVEDRQRCIYNHAYSTCDADWVFVVDIDEFVFGDGRIADLLGSVDDNMPCVRFMTAEAVYKQGEDIYGEYFASSFRTPIGKYLSHILSLVLYGTKAQFFIRGLLGHSRGKHALRAGISGAVVGLHESTINGTALTEINASITDDFWLAHYDAIDFRQWVAKFERRIMAKDTKEMGSKREKQVLMFENCRTLSDKQNLFRDFYSLNKWQHRILKMLGLIKNRVVLELYK